ncbi:MAG: GyrI-like domain-containing protein [Cardiobacterium hominis]
MSVDYRERLRPVIRYLEQHYREPLDLAVLAERAALSPYHFHRVYKAVTGETPAATVRRLRLENIARQLFFAANADITTLALEHGYASSQALAKAFRAHFGMTARDIRACRDFESWMQAMQNSKIGYLLHKNGHAAHAGNGATAPVINPQEQAMTTDMQTTTLAPCTVAYIRVTGEYGKNYEPATNCLYQWAGAHGLADGECLFIYLDSPEITPADKCRTDICLTVPDDTATGNGIEKRHLPGGSYALIRRTVTDPAQYRVYWEEIMSAVIAAQLEIDDRPCFEQYHHYDAATGKADVSFCVAVVL